jgi:hypothetical protein
VRVPTRILSAAAIAALAGAMFFAEPVSAGGPCPQPSAPGADGAVKAAGPKASGYAGFGIYNLDGDDQSIGLRTLAGRTKKAFVKYRNADSVPHSVRIAAGLTENVADFSVVIVRSSDGKDFTNRILTTGKVFKNVAPGGAIELKVFITKKAAAPASSSLDVTFHGNYNSGLASCGDTVELKPFPES